MPTSEYLHSNVPDEVAQLLGGRSREPENTEIDAIGRVYWPGYLLTLLSCIFFAGAATFIKVATFNYQMSSVTVVYFSSLVMVCFSMICIILNQGARESTTQLKGNDIGGIFMRGLIGTATVLLLYKAFVLIPVGQADAVFFVTPAFTLILAAVALRERILIVDALLALGSIVGAIMISSPAIFISLSSHDAFIEHGENFRRERVFGVTSALLAAVFNAVGMVLTRGMTHKVHFLHFVFALGVCGVLLTALMGYAANPLQVYADNPRALFSALSVGACATLAQILVHASLYFVPAGRAALMRNCEVPLVYFLATILLAETPTLVPFLGSIVVVASAITIGIRHLLRR